METNTITAASTTRRRPRPNRHKMASIGVAAMRRMADTEDTAASSTASWMLPPTPTNNNTEAAAATTVTVRTSGGQPAQTKSYIAAPVTPPVYHHFTGRKWTKGHIIRILNYNRNSPRPIASSASDNGGGNIFSDSSRHHRW